MNVSSFNAAAQDMSPVMPVEVVPSMLYALGASVPASTPLPWISPAARGWIPFQCYALRSAGNLILIDGGLAVHRQQIAAGLSALLEPATSLTMMITRRDVDSIINIPWLLRTFRFDLIRFANADFTPLDFFAAFDQANAEAQVYAITPPAKVEWMPVGTVTAVGELRLEYFRTSMRVLATNWLYEATSRTLFTSDSFGFLTRGQAGGQLAVQPGQPELAVADIIDFLNAKFDWLVGSDTSAMIAELTTLIQERPIDRVCPAYGCIIEGKEAVSLLFAQTIEAMRILGDRPRQSVLKGFDWSIAAQG